MTIGERIKKARKKAGLTQKALADKLGIPYQGISQYERGVRKPKLETLDRIAEALGVNFLDLVLRENFWEEILQEDQEAEEEHSRQLYWNRIDSVYFNLAPISGVEFAKVFCRSFPQLNDQGQKKVQAYLEDTAKIAEYHKEPVPRPKPGKVAPFVNPDSDKAPSPPPEAPKTPANASGGETTRPKRKTPKDGPQEQKDGPKQEPEEQ